MDSPSDLTFDEWVAYIFDNPPGYHFDDDLRDVPDQPDDLRRALPWLAEAAADPTRADRDRARLYGMLGVYARMLHEYATAHAALAQALRLAEQLADSRLQLVNRIRLAHVYQWQGAFEQSNALFAAALADCTADPALAAYLDFAHQHAGKNAFDQGRYAEAAQHFERALALRLQRGDPALIASTEHALTVTRRRL